MSRVPLRLPQYVIEWLREGTHVRVVHPGEGRDIQRKINDLYVTDGFGVVIVPPGSYMVHIHIEVPPNVALLGCGRASKIILADGVDDNVIQNLNHYLNSGDSNIIIGYLQIDGNGANQSAFSIGISLKGTVDSMIIGNYVHDCYADGLGYWGAPKRCSIIGNVSINCNKGAPGWNAIFVEGEVTSYAEDCVVANNVGINAGQTSGYGIHCAMAKNSSIVGNVFNNNAVYGINVTDSYEVTVGNNTCKLNGNYGIRITGSENCVVEGNTSRENSEGGIMIADASVACVVDGNIVVLNNAHGICINSSNYNTVTGNIARNNSQGGVGNNDGILLIGDASYNTVVGNTCFDDQGTRTQRYGIWEFSGDWNVIVGNMCQRNQHATTDIAYVGANSKIAWNIGRYVAQGVA